MASEDRKVMEDSTLAQEADQQMSSTASNSMQEDVSVTFDDDMEWM